MCACVCVCVCIYAFARTASRPLPHKDPPPPPPHPLTPSPFRICVKGKKPTSRTHSSVHTHAPSIHTITPTSMRGLLLLAGVACAQPVAQQLQPLQPFMGMHHKFSFLRFFRVICSLRTRVALCVRARMCVCVWVGLCVFSYTTTPPPMNTCVCVPACLRACVPHSVTRPR